MQTFVRFVARSAFHPEAGLHCVGYGYEAWKTHTCGPRHLGSYAVLWVPRGSGWIETAATPGRMRIAPCSLVWLFPTVTHRYAPDPAGWEEHWVIFAGPLADAFAREGVLTPAQPVWPVHGTAGDEVADIFARLGTDFAQATPALELLGGAAITRLIVRGSHVTPTSLADDAAPHARHEILRQAQGWIDEHATETIDFPALAQELGLGYSTFRRHFLAATGLTPKSYQLHARLTKAKELLASTWLSVTEVAHASGFEDAYYFSRLFHQKEALSPSAFRQHYHLGAETRHSHSMVAGGLEVTSKTTRLTPGTSLTMRLATRPSRS